MFKSTLRSVPLVIALCLLAACGSEPYKPGSTAKDPQSAYAEAKELMDSGSYESAITAYEQLEARFPYGSHAQQAQIDTAYAHFRMNDTGATIAACDRFIRLHPTHPNVDYAYYLKGLAYIGAKTEILSFLPQQPLSERDSKAMSDAFESFRQIVTRYPDSRYFEDSRTKMVELVNAMGTSEVVTARYYMKRRAPLAAINRAQTILTKFPESSAVEEALAIMVQAYQALEMTTMRDDAERVLRKNYPQSRFLASSK